MIPIQGFSERRHRLASQMQKGVAIIPTANRDAHYPYRFDSYFYYLTGFGEPESVLVIVAGGDKDASKSILFCREKNVELEIWNGFRYGLEGAREAFGFDETYPIAKLDEMLPRLLADQPAVFCALGDDTAWDARVIGWINRVRQQSRSGTVAPAEIRDSRVAALSRQPKFVTSGFCWMRCVCSKARKSFR